MTAASPEIGRSIVAAGIRTNYHDLGRGFPLLMLHGSGPGVSAWANWRLVMPELAEASQVIAPDLAGFGFSERPKGYDYTMDHWVEQAVGLLDALDIPQADLVGNSFGGALALALTIRHPQRVRRLVLMGSVGVPFEITPGLVREIVRFVLIGGAIPLAAAIGMSDVGAVAFLSAGRCLTYLAYGLVSWYAVDRFVAVRGDEASLDPVVGTSDDPDATAQPGEPE